MNTCQSCGCNPCACPGPTALANARLIDPVATGGTWTGGAINGATLNGGTSNGQQITGATIDCTTLVCTQPPGTCDGTTASTGFVCQAVTDAVSGANPDFCNAVAICLGAAPGTCGLIANCINTTPGIIQNPAAFDPLTFATIAQWGPIRVATLAEVQGASCLLAIDPCTLGAFFSAGGPNALWTAFIAAVDAVIPVSASLCAAVAACGFAPLASPVFTGDPQAPTPIFGDNDTSIATTAFVQQAVAGAPLPSCAAIAALWTPAGAAPPGPTGLLGDDCFSYTVANVFAATDAQSAMSAVVAATLAPIFFSSAAVGNIAATETPAYIHFLTPGRLNANGAAIEFEASGTFSASGSVNKRIRVYFGTTIVFDSGPLAIASADWQLKGTIARVAAASQKVMTTLTTSDATVQAIADYATALEDTTLVQQVNLTFNGTLANDVVGQVYRDRFTGA